jgi:hypothetical protein
MDRHRGKVCLTDKGRDRLTDPGESVVLVGCRKNN